jgi:hypothetical protein
MANPQEGKPIWIESILTDEEYRECSKKYPNSFTNGPVKPLMFPCEFKWRYRMGAGMNTEELKIYNKRISSLEEILRKSKEKVNE